MVVGRGLFKQFNVNARVRYDLLQFNDDTIIVRDGSWQNGKFSRL